MRPLMSLRKKLARASVLTLFVSAACLMLALKVHASAAPPPQAPSTPPPEQEKVNYQNTLNDFETFLNRLLDRTMTGQAAGGGETGGDAPDPTSPLLTNPEVYRLYMAFLNSGQSSEQIMIETQKKLQGATDATIKEIVKQLAGLLGTP